MNLYRRAGRFGTLMLGLLALNNGLAFGQVSLVRDGKACAVVVTAVDPSPVATYAVEEW